MSDERIGSRLKYPQGDLEPMVRRALERIDSLHTILDVPEVPVVYTEESRFGAYVPEGLNAARHFEISRVGPFPELTLTHEIGHFLDHALGHFDVYLSKEPSSMLSEVKRALENSRAISQMRDYLRSSTDLSRLERNQLEYWLDEREQWARAYAQFIAMQSGDAGLLRDLKLSQHLEPNQPAVYQNVQWDTDDFVPVGKAIEATFRKWGWMV